MENSRSDLLYAGYCAAHFKHIFSLNPERNLHVKKHYFPFKNEDTEARRGWVISQDHLTIKWRN